MAWGDKFRQNIIIRGGINFGRAHRVRFWSYSFSMTKDPGHPGPIPDLVNRDKICSLFDKYFNSKMWTKVRYWSYPIFVFPIYIWVCRAARSINPPTPEPLGPIFHSVCPAEVCPLIKKIYLNFFAPS